MLIFLYAGDKCYCWKLKQFPTPKGAKNLTKTCSVEDFIQKTKSSYFLTCYDRPLQTAPRNTKKTATRNRKRAAVPVSDLETETDVWVSDSETETDVWVSDSETEIDDEKDSKHDSNKISKKLYYEKPPENVPRPTRMRCSRTQGCTRTAPPRFMRQPDFNGGWHVVKYHHICTDGKRGYYVSEWPEGGESIPDVSYVQARQWSGLAKGTKTRGKSGSPIRDWPQPPDDFVKPSEMECRICGKKQKKSEWRFVPDSEGVWCVVKWQHRCRNGDRFYYPDKQYKGKALTPSNARKALDNARAKRQRTSSSLSASSCSSSTSSSSSRSQVMPSASRSQVTPLPVSSSSCSRFTPSLSSSSSCSRFTPSLSSSSSCSRFTPLPVSSSSRSQVMPSQSTGFLRLSQFLSMDRGELLEKRFFFPERLDQIKTMLEAPSQFLPPVSPSPPQIQSTSSHYWYANEMDALILTVLFHTISYYEKELKDCRAKLQSLGGSDLDFTPPTSSSLQMHPAPTPLELRPLVNRWTEGEIHALIRALIRRIISHYDYEGKLQACRAQIEKREEVVSALLSMSSGSGES